MNELKEDLKQKVPALETVREGFKGLTFTNDETKHKKLIQYIFRRWELFLTKTYELEPAQISIEHIAPQTEVKLEHCVGSIGNLLPLGGQINNIADTKDFKSKIGLYKQSKLSTVAEFVNKYEGRTDWTEKEINERTIEIADLAFMQIWKL